MSTYALHSIYNKFPSSSYHYDMKTYGDRR
jgi:hypothetical protein